MSSTDRIASALETHRTLNAPDTNNATWFNYKENTEGYWDSPNDWYRTTKYSYYQHLSEINRGRKRGVSYWNDPYHTFQANRDLIEVVASQLNLLPRQQKTAEAWFTHFDLDTWGLRVDLVSCCLCARIVHEDDTDMRQAHPNTSDDCEEKPIEFVELSDRFGLRRKEIPSTYGKIESYIRYNECPDLRKFDQHHTDEHNPSYQVSPGDGK